MLFNNIHNEEIYSVSHIDYPSTEKQSCMNSIVHVCFSMHNNNFYRNPHYKVLECSIIDISLHYYDYIYSEHNEKD